MLCIMRCRELMDGQTAISIVLFCRLTGKSSLLKPSKTGRSGAASCSAIQPWMMRVASGWMTIKAAASAFGFEKNKQDLTSTKIHGKQRNASRKRLQISLHITIRHVKQTKSIQNFPRKNGISPYLPVIPLNYWNACRCRS